MPNSSQGRMMKDLVLLATGAKLLNKFGVTPGSFYGGTALGFCAGNMAGLYGFDARETLSAVSDIEKKVKESD